MLSSVRWYSLFLFLILFIRNSKSTEIQLKPPSFSAKYENDPDPRVSSKELAINPCNGTYLKTVGTTCGLKEIMIGRCYNHQFVKRNLYLSSRNDVKNCTELYQLFESAVRYKSHCNMNMSTYEAYFNRALDGVHVIDRAIFWSGTYAVAHEYSNGGYNYITLEDTLAAGMADGLTWCGKENDTEGFNYVNCSNYCADNKWADLSFWGLASQKFAQLVAGEIYVILNGSRTDGRPAYRNDSYFALFELPNFKRNGTYAVTKINILLLHAPDHSVVERCGEKSLIDLENFIRNNGFGYECIDDPDELLMVMCGDQWNARECQAARKALRKEWDWKLFRKSHGNYQSYSIFLLILSKFLSDFLL